MQTSMPGKDGPPYAMMPSYITEFQSSPVRICGERKKCGKKSHLHKENLFHCKEVSALWQCILHLPYICKPHTGWFINVFVLYSRQDKDHNFMDSIITWNTVSRDWGKLSKVLRRVSSKLNFPPKSCMPSKEKMMMKRKSRSSREAMERTELSREATRLDREFQYLGERPVNMSAYAKTKKDLSLTNILD